MDFNLNTPFQKFDSHLAIHENKIVLVSGKFGIGKSFFLRSYFRDLNHEKFNVIFINPVNYVPNSSLDIFELIKVDIIKQLFIDDVLSTTEIRDFSKFDYSVLYLLKEPQRFFNYIIKVFPLLDVTGGILGKGLEGILKFSEALKKFSVNQRLEMDKLNPDIFLGNFLSEYLDSSGSYLEMDIVSEMISNILHEIKGDKKNVLIIDDLDRLDPDHIFRLLNVFSIHWDDSYRNSKFGFDHIILVGDIKNIEVVFKHRYGEKADFNGYIDKFYSKIPFYFSNMEAVKAFFLDEENENTLGLSKEGFQVLAYFLMILLEKGIINLRDIKKLLDWEHTNFPEIEIYSSTFREIFKNDKYSWKNEGPSWFFDHEISFREKDIYVNSSDFEVVKLLKLLVIVTGSIPDLRSSIDAIRDVDIVFQMDHLSTGTSFVKLLGPWKYFLEKHSKKEYSDIFYQYVDVDVEDEKEKWKWPRFSFGEIELQLRPNYARRSYNGNESYYQGFEVVLQEDIDRSILSSHNPKNELAFSKIIEELKVIFSLMDDANWWQSLKFY